MDPTLSLSLWMLLSRIDFNPLMASVFYSKLLVKQPSVRLSLQDLIIGQPLRDRMRPTSRRVSHTSLMILLGTNRQMRQVMTLINNLDGLMTEVIFIPVLPLTPPQ